VVEHERVRSGGGLRKLAERIEGTSGIELKKMVNEEGWDSLLRKIGGTYDDLRTLQEQDPEAWEGFRDAHLTARANVSRDRPDGDTAVAVEGDAEP